MLAMKTKRALVLVCRSWNHLAIHLLYQHIVIRSPVRAEMILQALTTHWNVSSNPKIVHSEYGQWTRFIELYFHMRGSYTREHLQNVVNIFRCCPNIRMLSATLTNSVPLGFRDAISGLFGPSLQGLHWDELTHSLIETKVTPEFFASFRSLRILDLHEYIGCDVSDMDFSLPSPTLPCVEHLILGTHHQCLLTATLLSLPALRKLTIQNPGNTDPQLPELIASFLQVHGTSLLLVDLRVPLTTDHKTVTPISPDLFFAPGVCPNLDTVAFSASTPPLAGSRHPTLRRIGIRGVNYEGLHLDKDSATKKHLKSFTKASYPKLETVRTLGYLVDADTDLLARDAFIWWAERFEYDGVDFQDGEGVFWSYAESAEDECSKLSGAVVAVGTSALRADLTGDLEEDEYRASLKAQGGPGL